MPQSRDGDEVARPLLHGGGADEQNRLRGEPRGVSTPSYAESFLDEVAEGVRKRDLQRLKREMVRSVSFISAVVNCFCVGSIMAYSLYGHLFLSRLHYTQIQVNMVSIAGELAMYLPICIFGYLCDRYGPRPVILSGGVFFGLGYLLAAFTYRAGAPRDGGWPVGVMILAFIGVGMGTSAMYLASVATTAKNFGRGKHKGLTLAIPITAIGLSSMWLSQVASRVLYERRPDGSRGDVDVFKFFIFLAVLLFVLALIGSVALRVVDEEEMIEEAVEDLQRSGLLEESNFFRGGPPELEYGTFGGGDGQADEEAGLAASGLTEAEESKQREEEEQKRKIWLLNGETRRFLKDKTMWWFAAGFFLVTGPGEAFLNNLGTVIGTLYPPSTPPSSIPTSAATHVSIMAITSTLARLITGTLSDLVAPASTPHAFPHPQPSSSSSPPFSPSSSLSSSSSSTLPPSPPSLFSRILGPLRTIHHSRTLRNLHLRVKRLTLSRLTFLISFAFLLSLGTLFLATGLVQNHAERFWLVSGLIGAGYGAVFALAPIITSLVWGLENFGTNWGIVAMVPAAGATVWGLVYSAVYQRMAERGVSSSLSPTSVSTNLNATLQTPNDNNNDDDDVLCYGTGCYAPTFYAMSVSVWIACGLWLFAWKGKGGWARRGIRI
ncbi:MFS general substrate transporter [Xylona heveae TC161]|uniref:Probable transporter MCH1 n=1 Tax=Xylona heveae (strain CBS 132557 / TC161) TaxID=1328760 RepID=A0A164ZS58_XYLHT|nr:MFS general substrate transporter [Xylona heveae TC161]KZF19444.1 MFS general substrate transporter [Xylona heveae TC161]